MKEAGSNAVLTGIWEEHERVSTIAGTVKVRDAEVNCLLGVKLELIKGILAILIPKVWPFFGRIAVTVLDLRVFAADNLLVLARGTRLVKLGHAFTQRQRYLGELRRDVLTEETQST